MSQTKAQLLDGKSATIQFTGGSASAPSVSFTGDTNTGIYSPGADQVAISTGGSGRLFVDASGNVGVGVSASAWGGSWKTIEFLNGHSFGSAGTQAAVGQNLFNNGSNWIYKTSAPASFYQLNAGEHIWYSAPPGTAGNSVSLLERLRITSAGLVGVGTSSPSALLSVASTTTSYTAESFNIGEPSLSTGRQLYMGYNTTDGVGFIQPVHWGTEFRPLVLCPNGGRVGIGTTAPQQGVSVVAPSTAQALGIWNRALDNLYGGIYFKTNDGTIDQSIILNERAGTNGANLLFYTKPDGGNVLERARIDSSGRLLVGTSTGPSDSTLVLQGNSSNSTYNSVLRMLRNVTNPAANAVLGSIIFGVGDAASSGIECYTDGQWGANDYPGRLVFSTTADGASAPTERMRITSAGFVLVGNTSVFSINSTSTGLQLSPDGAFVSYASATPAAYFSRQTNDGIIIDLRQDGIAEGSISVSGSTVSYNGAHLSRWSQLPSGAERTEILRGSVLSNIDEMCEWGEENNEQLNRMKISDIEGDKNVSGVFQAWDDDDDTYTNDFYCAMTGDFIVRIGAGVTVERGDLLMSAGDGTAKPQDDDIIRSKTIAKVTSTNVSCTYEDGSYCVPCVLMAC